MGFVFYISSDGRIKTQEYLKGGAIAFCIAEKTRDGSLITEFDQKGEILNQIYKKGGDAHADLKNYLGISDSQTKDAGAYSGLVISAQCKECRHVGLQRELDLHAPGEIKDVPIVPIFLCQQCKKRHYSLTDQYLRVLVDGNGELFEESEKVELGKGGDGSLGELQEYIIRIFASKRISRIEIR